MAGPRILILSRYDQNGASSRVRMVRYLPYLQEAGFETTVQSFFDPEYLDALYAGRSIGIGVLRHYLRRIARMLAGRQFALMWVEKEALPWLPWLFERLLLPASVPLASDFDDAVFHRYDQHPSPVVRGIMGNKIDRVMAHSSVVMAGNDYLADRATQAGAARVELVPTVVDVEDYALRGEGPRESGLRVGWIGTPQTWTEFGAPMLRLIREIVDEHGAVFRAIGAKEPSDRIPGCEFIGWSETSEIELLQSLDIGIMPLPDTAWAKGKCGYKLIQYMACGLPVVASPVGVNCKIVEHDVNGFLAATDDEWRTSLARLLSDSGLRQTMGRAGRRKIETEFSIQKYGPRVVELFLDLAGARQ